MDIILRVCFRTVLLTYCCCLLMMPVVADEETDNARNLLVEVTRKMFDELNRNQEKIKSEPGLLKSLIKKNLELNISIDTTSRRVMGGKHWKIASDTQRQEFSREFSKLLLNFYSSGLREYLRNTDERFHMEIVEFGEPARSKDNDRYVDVDCFFTLDGQQPYKIIYRMIRIQDGWKVYDVVTPHGSVVRNYRMQFKGKITTSGIDGLIDALEKRNRDVDILSRLKSQK